MQQIQCILTSGQDGASIDAEVTNMVVSDLSNVTMHGKCRFMQTLAGPAAASPKRTCSSGGESPCALRGFGRPCLLSGPRL